MAAEPLEIFAEILELSRRMLALARAGKWDELIAQEAARQQAIGRLKDRLAKAAPLPSGSDARKNALIREILDLDEETRHLTESGMADLKDSLASVGVSKQLNSAYLRP